MKRPPRPPRLADIFLLMWVVFVSPSTAVQAEIVDRIVGIVNEEIITQRELEERAYPILLSMPGEPTAEEVAQIRKNVMVDLVKNKLVIQAAKEKRILLDREEVERVVKSRLDSLSGQYGAEFENVLSEQGYSLAEFMDLMRREAKQELIKSRLIAQAVEGAVVVTDDDIRTRYTSRMLVTRSPETAFKALLQLKSGTITFPNAVREFSSGGEAGENGEMGSYLIGTWSEEIEAEVVKLRAIGDLSGVIQTAAGFVIVQLVDRRLIPMDEISQDERRKIKDRLIRLKSVSESNAYVSSLWDRAYVKFID